MRAVRGRESVVSPRMTLWEAFAARVASAPQREALVADDGRVTAAGLSNEARAVGSRLLEAGVSPGDRVLVLLPNSLRYAATLFGAARIGVTVVPMTPSATVRELRNVLPVTGARAAVLDSSAESAAADAFGDQGVRVLPYECRLARDETRPNRDAGERGSPVTVSPSDPALLFLTSGTTGAPKLVTHTHRGLIASFLKLERMHAEFFSGSVVDRFRRVSMITRRYGRRALRAARRQTWMTAIPFHAIGGHEVLIGACLGGHALVTAAGFHPRRAIELLERERVNVFPATPAMVESMLGLRDFDEYDLSSLLVVGLGSAPARPELVRRAQTRFRCGVTVGYGSTELGGGVLVSRIEDSDEVRSETVGRPFPGAEIRIVDEAGKPVGDGEIGELWCRVESVMSGYGDADAELAGIRSRAVDDDGWYHTNDLAVRDASGSVRIVGRRDDLIIRGGNKIRPAEVEVVLEAMDGVHQAAVVGVAADRVGQQVWAFVVADDAGRAVDRARLLEHCRKNLSPSKVPDHVRLCESLPLTDLGKVQRHRLVERALEESSAPIGAQATEGSTS